MGLQRLLSAVEVQQLEGEVYPMRLLRRLLLAQQVHLPLPSDPRRQVQPPGRRQLQLLASTPQAYRRGSAGRGSASRLGRCQGHVQRRKQTEASVQSFEASASRDVSSSCCCCCCRAGERCGRCRRMYPCAWVVDGG